MNTTFVISGGAGRVIASIPALEKYARLNPHDDFKVIIHGWENLLWSHPVLQNRTFGFGQKGMFEFLIKDSRLVSPEPYHNYNYYNQKISLAEAFDEEINNTTDHSDLNKPNLYLSSVELASTRALIEKLKNEKKKKKFIVFQPYGSGINFVEGRPYDPSHRSLDVDDALFLGRMLNQESVVLYFGPNEFVHPLDDFMVNTKEIVGADLRFFMAMIHHCDYFIGVDSVGQHMARAMNKPGTVIMGSTNEINVSYPNYFNIERNGQQPIYNPIRIGGIDCELTDRINQGIMDFNSIQLQNIYSKIKL
jgi:ADP-heptose:LPS heptosyltransferase